MSRLYKLLTAAILSACVSQFVADQNLMSTHQKSARPSEGCHEHTFTLQSIVEGCKRVGKNCFFAWLDPCNVFGSISHDAIYTTLKYMGFPESLIDQLKDIYYIYIFKLIQSMSMQESNKAVQLVQYYST